MTRSSALQDRQESDWEPLVTFSDTIALLYEAQIDFAKAPQARRALQQLLQADELAVFADPLEPCGRPQHAADTGTFFRARSDGHVLWIDIGEPPSGPLRIQFRRHASYAPFSTADVQMLSLLRRHLNTAHCLEILTNRDMFGCLASAQLAQSMLKGVLIVDSDRRIHWRNPAANDILTSRGGLAEEDSLLCARRTFETARLQALVRKACDGVPGVMLVARPAEKHPYGLAFAPVKSSARQLLDDPRHRSFALVTIKEMRRQIRLITERLGELFGFSPAEEKLGALLLDGCSLQEAARQSEKALPTIKTQLRSMLKKTGAHSQAELMNVFLSLPSIF